MLILRFRNNKVADCCFMALKKFLGRRRNYELQNVYVSREKSTSTISDMNEKNDKSPFTRNVMINLGIVCDYCNQ